MMNICSTILCERWRRSTILCKRYLLNDIGGAKLNPSTCDPMKPNHNVCWSKSRAIHIYILSHVALLVDTSKSRSEPSIFESQKLNVPEMYMSHADVKSCEPRSARWSVLHTQGTCTIDELCIHLFQRLTRTQNIFRCSKRTFKIHSKTHCSCKLPAELIWSPLVQARQRFLY